LAVVGFTEIKTIEGNVDGTKIRIAGGVVELNDGGNDGMVNVRELTTKLNALEGDLNDLKTALTGWVPVPQDGGAALKTAAAAWAGKQLQTTAQGDIEDIKVKH
jgi:hypothetical protein